jgi:hypothetical protein
VWAMYAYDVVCSEHEKRSEAVGWDLGPPTHPAGDGGREGWPVVILVTVHKNWSTAQFPK